MDVDNGVGSTLIEDGSAIVRLDGMGNFLKAYRFTSDIAPANVDLSGMATDEAGNLYVSGTYRGELTAPNGQVVASDDIDIFLVTLYGAIPVRTQNPSFDVAPRLFPNPATDRVSILLDRAYAAGKITVLGADGRRWQDWEFGGTERVDLGVRNLPVGYYLIRISAGRRTSTVPLVVRR